MGSFGDVWLQCKACRVDGKCRIGLPAYIPELLDIDGYGLMCELCHRSIKDAYPRLTARWFEDKFPSPVAKLIARMAYPRTNTKRPFTRLRGMPIFIRGEQHSLLECRSSSSSDNSSSDGRRSAPADRKRAAKADARGWTRKRRKTAMQQSSTWQWSSSEWSSSEWHGAWSSSGWHGAWSSSESQTHGGGAQLVRD